MPDEYSVSALMNKTRRTKDSHTHSLVSAQANFSVQHRQIQYSCISFLVFILYCTLQYVVNSYSQFFILRLYHFTAARKVPGVTRILLLTGDFLQNWCRDLSFFIGLDGFHGEKAKDSDFLSSSGLFGEALRAETTRYAVLFVRKL